MKKILLMILMFPSSAYANKVTLTREKPKVTISVSANVVGFQVIDNDGNCFINGNAIDCEEIGGFIEHTILNQDDQGE